MNDVDKINEELYKDHENRPDLAGEHPLGDTYQLILMIVFVIVIVIDLLFIRSDQLIRRWVPFLVRFPPGVGAIILGSWLALRGMQIVFKEYRPDPVMITEGMFSKVRHPIYLGAMLVYVGVLLLTLSLLGGIVFLFVIVIYNWLAKHEEKLMLEIFQEEYKRYMQRVPMWLPKLF